MSQVGAFFSSINPAGAVLELTGNNTGVHVAPTLGNINIVGTGLITVTGDAATHTLTISSAGATADQFDGDTGSAIPVAGILNIVGSANMHTAASGNSVEVILDDDVSISGSFTAGTTAGFITSVTGDITASAGNFNLPTTLSTADEGVITINSKPFIHNLGSNIVIGKNAANFTLTPGVAINNTIIGEGAFGAITSGANNCVIGEDAMLSATSSNNCTILGATAMAGLVSGINNIAIGAVTGSNYLTNESNNILVNSAGTVGDNHTIRIGEDGSGNFQQNKCFIAGILGNTVSNTQIVTIDSTTGQLGVTTGGAIGASTFATDSGSATESAGTITIAGGSNINTSGAAATVTVNLDDTVSISGSFTAGTTAGFITSQTGDISATAGNFNLADTNSSGTQGVINFGVDRFIHKFGNGNTFIGQNAGNFTLNTIGAINNIAIGENCLQGITTGPQNIIIGTQSFPVLDSGENNINLGTSNALTVLGGLNNIIIGSNILLQSGDVSDCIVIGNNALQAFTGAGGANISIGTTSLTNLDSGSNNLALGTNAGSNYFTTESNNIIIGSHGVSSDANIIRIGTQGSSVLQQNKCFIAGIIGNTVSSPQLVTINSTTGQLGVTSTSGSTWQVVTGATNLVRGNGYFANGSSKLNFTLPTTAAVGDTFEIAVLNTSVGGWQINQNASQYIIGNSNASAVYVTTVGTGGNVATAATVDWQFVKVICAIANTAFVVECSAGGLIFT